MNYKFLIYISYSYSIPIGKPLEKEIQRLGYHVQWYADEAEGMEKLSFKSNLLADINAVLDYDPHIILTATNVVPDFLKGLKVQVFHGFPAFKRPSKKNISSDFAIRGFFDLYCTQGPSSTLYFKELANKHKHFQVVETGWSKMDPLFPIESSLNNRTPVVMICSTFTQRLSLAQDADMYNEIKKLSKEGSFKFIATLHPKMPLATVEKWKLLENENFSFCDTTNLIPLFNKADIMLADTTSAIQEFLLLNRPVVSYRHTLSHNYLIHLDNATSLKTALQIGLKRDPELMIRIAEFAKFTHPYTDGKSSLRVIEASIKMLHQHPKNLAAKPFNFIRKFKIRKTTGHFSLLSYNKPLTLPNAERLKITALIPTGNEAHNIDGVVDSVSFADEILVVDSYSKDGTYDKALEKADRIIRRKYENSASQKNWAIPHAKYEWILLLDADERVTPELKSEILEILNNPPQDGIVAYWIYRKNHFMGRQIRYSGWQNDKVIRLFQRDKCRYEEKMVHAEIIADGKVGYLKNKLYHNTYTTIDNHISKLNRYATWQALDYDNITGKLGPYHFVIKPLWSFLKHYILQMGIRDGVVGIVISSLQAYSVFMRYTKLWLYRRNSK